MALSMSVVYTDANGYQTIHRIRTLIGASNIAAAIYADSNAQQSTTWESAETAPSAPPIAAVFLPGNVTAVLTFQCADLTEVTIRIPAPRASIFFPDGRTVDPTTIPILIADCIGNLVSTSNSPATTYISGVRSPGT